MSATTTPDDKVAAVVVTFQPDLDRLSALLDATLPQVEHIYIVDNGDGKMLQALLPGRQRTSLIALGENRGVGAAQNVGAQAAIGAGTNYILLLDQDSVPDPGMVSALRRALQALGDSGHRVAAVGPRAPSRENPGAFVTFGWFRYRSTAPAERHPWVFCDLLIASGSLIPASAFQEVGPMDESLFIDKVDTEWSIRAAACGYRLAGVPSAVLKHSVGERTIRVWWFGWKHLPAHHPFRYYYIVRNCILICRRPYVGWRWRTADIRQTIGVVFVFGLAASASWLNLQMMMRGLVDGLRTRSGPFVAGGSRSHSG